MDLRIGVLTVSDRVSRGDMEDRGGPAIVDALSSPQRHITHRAVVQDDVNEIASVLRSWADDGGLDVVLTTGGTGLGPRDVTPEATRAVAPRDVPGIAETLRATGLRHTPHSMLSRGVSAVRGATLIINLPGSPQGAREGVDILQPILDHAVAILHGGHHRAAEES